jgi:hypothetical protein
VAEDGGCRGADPRGARLATERVAVRLRARTVSPGKALVGYDVFAGAHARMAASKRDLASGPRANGLMIGKSIPD